MIDFVRVVERNDDESFKKIFVFLRVERNNHEK